MEQPRVRFESDSNVEIEYEEEQIEDDAETYQQFVTLVEGVVNCLALLQTEMDNYLYFKDELMQQLLPPNLLLQLSLISGKLYRSFSDLQIPLWELLRLVRVYSSPWEEKRAALQKMHDDYSRKKEQLEIALRRLTKQDADVRRAARERRVMNWEKLFARVQMARGHGRRWKFRMYDFKRSADLGVEHLGKYFAEEQSDLESEPEETPREPQEAAEEEQKAEEEEAGGEGGDGEGATAADNDEGNDVGNDVGNDEEPAGEDVTIPALFMPQRGQRKVYNPRAHQYFHPHGVRGARLTQPPAMLSLPPLHNGPSVLNLFDLGVRSSHPGHGASSLGSAPPNSVIQTQLNLLKRAAN